MSLFLVRILVFCLTFIFVIDFDFFLDQVPKEAEFANVNLLQRHEDYFLHVTTYIPQEKWVHDKKTLIVFDAGLKKQFIFSNGLELGYRIPITKNLKDRHRYFSRTEKHSRNRHKKRTRL